MKFGVYRKIKGHTGVGLFYQFLGLARYHDDKDGSGPQMVVYIPLRVEPGWAGTLRMCLLERERFEGSFEYVAEGLPE